jgi:hypothetical protein
MCIRDRNTLLTENNGFYEPGENGHSTVMIQGNELVLFYQSRLRTTDHRWRYGIARAQLRAANANSAEAATG